MKKRNVSKINYKMFDCKIRQLDKIVTISYCGEIVCEITNVKNYTKILSLIKCMFQGGLMYSKISSSELNRLFKDNEKSTFRKNVEKVVEKVNDTVKSVKIVNVVERTLKVIKKWIYTVNNLLPVILKNEITDSIVYEDPIQNLRFNQQRR